MHFSRIVFGLALASASTALPSSSSTSKQQGKNGKATPLDPQQQQQQQQQLENDGLQSQDHQAKSSSPFHQASSQHIAGQAITGSSFNGQEGFQQKQDSSLNHLIISSSQEQEQEIQQRSNGNINGASFGIWGSNKETSKVGQGSGHHHHQHQQQHQQSGALISSRGKQNPASQQVPEGQWRQEQNMNGQGMNGVQEECRADEGCVISGSTDNNRVQSRGMGMSGMQEKCHGEECVLVVSRSMNIKEKCHSAGGCIDSASISGSNVQSRGVATSGVQQKCHAEGCVGSDSMSSNVGSSSTSQQTTQQEQQQEEEGFDEKQQMASMGTSDGMVGSH